MEVDAERNWTERMCSMRRHTDKMKRLMISTRFIVASDNLIWQGHMDGARSISCSVHDDMLKEKKKIKEKQ